MVDNGIFDPPRAFNSCAQPRRRSWTSSGATSVRSQASVHLGFAGRSVAAVVLACFLEAFASLLRKTREKKAGMVTDVDGCARPLELRSSFLWTVRIWIILRGCAFVFFELTCGQGGTFFFFFRPFCSRSTTPISYDITTRTGPEGRNRRPTDNDIARSEEKDEK